MLHQMPVTKREAYRWYPHHGDIEMELPYTGISKQFK